MNTRRPTKSNCSIVGMWKSAIPLLLCLGLVSRLIYSVRADDSSSTVCGAADSLARLSEFLGRNSLKLDADGYFGASIAYQTFAAAPKTVAETERQLVDSCGGESRAVEFRRSLDEIKKALDGFKLRVAIASGGKSESSGGYDAETYWRICRPMDRIVHRLLGQARFCWRRSEAPGVSANDGRESAEDAKAWLNATVSRLNSYGEAQGDDCFKRLLNDKSRSACYLPSVCRRLFLNSQPSVGYTLTHQLMFWVASIDRSCHLTISNGRRVDRTLVTSACHHALKEHKRILALGSAGNALIDLAMEQAVLCGILGFRDFFTDSTVLQFRRLQDERLGCFSQEEYSESLRTAEFTDAKTDTGRKLMHNVVLDGRCSSHSSGLAAAYFALFLRN